MISALCILLPLLLAAALPWLPAPRWVSLACAGLDLLLVASLPWTGTTLGGWLLPDPLSVHVMVLTGFAWVMAGATAALPPPLVVLVALLNLALLSGGAGLTTVAAGGAGVCAVLSLRNPAPALGLAVLGTGMAVFGTVLLYLAAAPALGPGWAALQWSALPQGAAAANGMALGAGFALMLLGLGLPCLVLPLSAASGGGALPQPIATLAGPLGATWLVVVLRLRGVLNGNGHAIPPGAVLLVAGFVGLAFAWFSLRRGGGVAAACLAMFASVLVGFGVGGAAATGAGLLHLTLGCLALTAAATGSRLGLAALAGVPPLGVFASGFALVADTAGRSMAASCVLVVGLFGVAAAALRAPEAPGSTSRLAWVGIGLALVGAWAMPPPLAAWMQGIAAAAR